MNIGDIVEYKETLKNENDEITLAAYVITKVKHLDAKLYKDKPADKRIVYMITEINPETRELKKYSRFSAAFDEQLVKVGHMELESESPKPKNVSSEMFLMMFRGYMGVL